MKTALILLFSTLSLNSSFATDFSTYTSSQDSVRTHLPNIVDRVHSCSVLPYSFRNGVKVFHAVTSHCPEVKVSGPGQAKVKVAGHSYFITLVEAEDSDGDFYHVQIKDVASGDSLVLNNVAAYGDVLLGILNGDTRGLMQMPLNGSDEQAIDVNLLRTHF